MHHYKRRGDATAKCVELKKIHISKQQTWRRNRRLRILLILAVAAAYYAMKVRVFSSVAVLPVENHISAKLFLSNDKITQPESLISDAAATITTLSSESTNQKTKTVAYAVSITSCSDTRKKPATPATNPHLIDSAAVLKHSIHLAHQSSQYEYTTHAFVYQDDNGNPKENACSRTLEQLGYKVQLVSTPIKVEEIRNSDLRKHVQNSGCCGEKEFLKLYSLTLTQYSIVVHLDLDSMLLKPIDDYLDLLTKRNPMDALYTRDYGMAHKDDKLSRIGVQGGFWMVRPNLDVFRELCDIVLDGADFEEGYGWGGRGLGKSWYYGAAQIQGLLSYYYSSVHPSSSSSAAVEVNRCYINTMSDEPNRDICSNETIATVNSISDHREAAKLNATHQPYHYCQDCSQTPLSEIYSAHFTKCQKPYHCRSLESILCLKLHYRWHEIRDNLEDHWRKISNSTTKAHKKTARKHYSMDEVTRYRDVLTTFRWHCRGTNQYKPLEIPEDLHG